MNRRKKAKQIFNKKLKKARAKLKPDNQQSAKPKYVSKADRLKLADVTEKPDQKQNPLASTSNSVSNTQPNEL
ncbi:MAG: DUF2986 domain-containing protein [Cellvibrionaceae bacterium]